MSATELQLSGVVESNTLEYLYLFTSYEDRGFLAQEVSGKGSETSVLSVSANFNYPYQKLL